jgi:hypothetical protein
MSTYLFEFFVSFLPSFFIISKSPLWAVTSTDSFLLICVKINIKDVWLKAIYSPEIINSIGWGSTVKPSMIY